MIGACLVSASALMRIPLVCFGQSTSSTETTRTFATAAQYTSDERISTEATVEHGLITRCEVPARGQPALLLPAAAVGLAAPEALTMIACSPGSPGTTAEAQPRMDAVATAVGTRAHVTLHASYAADERDGVAALEHIAIGLVSLPFFLAHERELDLHPQLIAVAAGRPALDRWAMVSQRGADLAGVTVFASVAYAPAFVRGCVLGQLGVLPHDFQLVQSTSVLSALRRAAAGEPVAVVVDGTEEGAVPSLPFASRLEVSARSPSLPAAVVVTVRDRVPAETWSSVAAAMRGLSADQEGTSALAGVQLARFVELDRDALAIARASYTEGAR